MITAADIQTIRDADPSAVLPGIDTMTGNPYATSSLLDLTKITQNSKAPFYYSPSQNTVFYQSPLIQTHGGGFPNRLKFVGPRRIAGGSAWRQQLVFGMIMARVGCGRRRNGRRMGRKRADCWLLRRFTAAPRALRRRRSGASGCKSFATGWSSSTRRARTA